LRNSFQPSALSFQLVVGRSYSAARMEARLKWFERDWLCERDVLIADS
jgi:hypothetical protein